MVKKVKGMITIKRNYNIYVDESGDPGINKGSKYFILSALIVEKSLEYKVSLSMDSLKKYLDIQNKALHWNKIKGTEKKLYVLNTLAKQDVVILSVIIDTSHIKYIPSSNLYTHYLSYLLERITWFLKANCGYSNIYISSRESISRTTLNEYIFEFNSFKFNINLNRIKNIIVVKNESMNILQYADVVASSLFQSLKYNNNIHFKYVLILKKLLYSYKDNYLSYGLKIVPKESNSKELTRLLEYLRKEL